MCPAIPGPAWRRVTRRAAPFCCWSSAVSCSPSGLNEDTPEALCSLDRLGGMRADVLLPGHGDPWTGGVAEAVAAAKIAGRS